MKKAKFVVTAAERGALSTLILTAMLARAGAANAQVVAPKKYTVFDLALPTELAPSDGIHIVQLQPTSQIASGDIFWSGSASPCKAGRSSFDLVVVYDSNCPLFVQPAPSSFVVLPVPAATDCNKPENKPTPDCTRSITVEFDAGEPVSGTYSGPLWLSTNVFGLVAAKEMDACVARWTQKAWTLVDLKLMLDHERVRSVNDVDDLPRQGTVYLRAGTCKQARQSTARPLAVSYTTRQKVLGVTFPYDTNTSTCSVYDVTKTLPGCPHVPKASPAPVPVTDPYPKARVAWVLYVDQANEKGTPRITYNPNNYILTNSFGRVRVRHWKNVNPVLTTTGSGSALTTATGEGGLAAVDATPLITGSVLAADGDASVTEFLVPPRAPGTLHVLVKFSDVDDPTKPRGEAGTDIIVDRSYSSALRFGVAHIFGLDDLEYKGVQHEKEGKFIVTQRSSEANEIVLGYALYLDWLLSYGRSYNLVNPCWRCAARLERHLGLYAGFGAVSYASGNFDYLKSFHLGVEVEIKNFSIAVTLVTRRTPLLNGSLRAGDGVVSPDVDTVERYRFGVGLVVNFSPEFLRFTAGGTK